MKNTTLLDILKNNGTGIIDGHCRIKLEHISNFVEWFESLEKHEEDSVKDVPIVFSTGEKNLGTYLCTYDEETLRRSENPSYDHEVQFTIYSLEDELIQNIYLQVYVSMVGYYAKFEAVAEFK